MALGLMQRLGVRTATTNPTEPTSITDYEDWQATIPNSQYHEIRVRASADPDFQRRVFHGFDTTGDPISVAYEDWPGATPTGIYAERWHRPGTQEQRIAAAQRVFLRQVRATEDAMEAMESGTPPPTEHPTWDAYMRSYRAQMRQAMERDLAEDAHQMRAAIDFYSWTGIPFAGGYWSISQDRP